MPLTVSSPEIFGVQLELTNPPGRKPSQLLLHDYPVHQTGTVTRGEHVLSDGVLPCYFLK